MATRRSPKVITDQAFRTKVEKNLKSPVLTMLEVPLSKPQKQLVEALNLKDGDILQKTSLTGAAVNTLTWFCSVSLPFDCDAGVDGG
jgi:hypothetical protein